MFQRKKSITTQTLFDEYNKDIFFLMGIVDKKNLGNLGGQVIVITKIGKS